MGSFNKIRETSKQFQISGKLAARCSGHVDTLKDSVEKVHKSSCRKRSQDMDLFRSLVHRIFKKDLQLYLCRIQIKHIHKKKHKNFLDNFWFSNEA